MIATIINPRLAELTVSRDRGSIDFTLEDDRGGRMHLRFGPGGACAAFFVDCFDAAEAVQVQEDADGDEEA